MPKKEREERFFYEVYPRRLQLYEEIIKETNCIGDEEAPSGCTSAGELSGFYKERCDSLVAPGYRCSLYGSPRVAGALASLVVVLAEGSKIALGLHDPLDSETKHNLISTIAPGSVAIKLKLLEFIGEESGTYIVDKKAVKFLRNPKKKKRAHKNAN